MVGPNTTAILNRFGGTSQTCSSDWSLCKHAVTPTKPGGGIAHWTTSDSLVGEGGSDWVANTLNSLVWGCQTNLSPKLQLWGLHFKPLNKGGICPVATMGLGDVAPSPNQGIGSEASSLQWVTWLHPQWLPSQGVSQCWLGTHRSGLFRWGCGRFLQKSYATEYILIREGNVALHLLPELHYTPRQKAWLTFGRQISLLCPKLKSFGIGHCLLLLQFLDIPAGKFRVGWWQKIPSAKTWQCWWGLVIILHLVSFTCPLGACTSCANFLWLSTPGTITNSCHQLGVSYVWAFQVT